MRISDGSSDVCSSDLVLQAEKIIFLTNAPGVLDKQERILTGMTVQQVEALIADGTIYGGMVPKVRFARDAVKRGGESANIDAERLEHYELVELFTDRSEEGRVGKRRVRKSEARGEQ